VRVLVVEDDEEIAQVLQRSLRLEGYEVKLAGDGVQGLEEAHAFLPDLIVLDLGLPRLDGVDVAKRLREDGDEVPILMLTARDALESRVEGLDIGADDYLVKPFDLDELAARVRALTRRAAGRTAGIVRHGPITLDPATREVRVRDRPVSLSAREYAVLEALIERPGSVLSRAQLEERLYGWGEEVASNAVEVHVHNLRRKLGAGLIRNERGVGYSMPVA
jgi:two-component system response regulator QseB